MDVSYLGKDCRHVTVILGCLYFRGGVVVGGKRSSEIGKALGQNLT